MAAQAFDAQRINAQGLTAMNTLLERIERLLTQKRQDKNKLYALHAPEVECIGKGKARKPYEFGVKASIAITHKSGLMVGALRLGWRAFFVDTKAQRLRVFSGAGRRQARQCCVARLVQR